MSFLLKHKRILRVCSDLVKGNSKATSLLKEIFSMTRNSGVGSVTVRTCKFTESLRKV